MKNEITTKGLKGCIKLKKLPVFVGALLLCIVPAANAYACTEFYAGSAVTADGKMWFGRTEDFAEDYPKQFYVSPAGKNKAGETYKGCYGFQWDFTHDSYSYTAFQDTFVDGVCPDCEGTHEHTPYQSAGTNEKGVSLTATESLYPSEESTQPDPFKDEGIEEADIATILLSEAASAREAMELLTEIYDTTGSCSPGAVLVADQMETWYIENLSGTQYVAIRLPDDLILLEPNMSIIGAVDLDDTENVVASEKLIATAVAAGTFVGDEKKNVINYAASFGAEYLDSGESPVTRLTSGLNSLNSEYHYTEDTIRLEDYCISNIDEDGSIVKPYTGIRTSKPVDRQTVLELFALPGIANKNNVETHIFAIDPKAETETAVVEWVGMGNAEYTVFVPYYPMLTDDVFDAYKGDAAVYRSFEGLSHLAADDKTLADKIQKKLDVVQSELLADWDEFADGVHQGTEKKVNAAKISKELAKKAFDAAEDILAEQYEVLPGDCLYKIAKQYLEDGNRWIEIYNLNKDKIKNPDLIYPGQILELPTE